MNITKEEYAGMVKKAAPASPVLADCVWAFFTGGAICCLGEALSQLFESMGLGEEPVKMAVPVTLVFLSALATGLGLYPKLAKHAGAGTLVPITGFANAVVSPAIEFQAEGQVTGTGAKIFTIAGPVLTFGFLASTIYGLIYWVFTVLM